MPPQAPGLLPPTHTQTHTLSQIRRHTESAYTEERIVSRKWIVRVCGAELGVCVCVLCVQVRKRHTLNKILTKGFFELLHMARTHTPIHVFTMRLCMHKYVLYVRGAQQKAPKNTQKTSSYLLYLSAKSPGDPHFWLAQQFLLPICSM